MYPPDPDTTMDDQITGPPPPPPQQPPSNGYAQFLRGGTSTAQALAAEGIQPAQPPSVPHTLQRCNLRRAQIVRGSAAFSSALRPESPRRAAFVGLGGETSLSPCAKAMD